jgi:sugar fermentation stimulation protein A
MKPVYLTPDAGGLLWGPLERGILIRRYNRFLADVDLNGDPVVAHCPNTGTMLGCSTPGWPVYLSKHDNPKRKLKYTWELTRAPASLVGVNTSAPNKLVKTAAETGLIPELAGYDRFRSEVKTGAHTRLDLVLEADGRETCYIEVKNCTLAEGGRACFPDAVTERGRKHLTELARLIADGGRGVIFFLVQRMDADRFGPADHIDPVYGQTLRQVMEAGVEALAYDTKVTEERIDINRRLPVDL